MVREVHDVGVGDRAPLRDERLADLEFLEVLPERMHARRLAVGAGHPLIDDARERRGRSLDRGALHVVQHAAHAAHLLAAAGASRTAVHQVRQRRSVSGRLLRAVAVDEQHPAVIRPPCRGRLSRAVSSLAVKSEPTSEPRPRLASSIASSTERVRHHRVHRAERLDVVRRGVVERLARSRTAATGKNAPRFGVGADDVHVDPARRRRAPRRAAMRSTLCRTSFTWARPASGPMRHALDRGIADLVVSRRFASARITSSTMLSGTIVRRIAVHFWPAFDVISRATSFTKRSNSSVPGAASGAEHREVERVRFLVEAHAVLDDRRDSP